MFIPRDLSDLMIFHKVMETVGTGVALHRGKKKIMTLCFIIREVNDESR